MPLRVSALCGLLAPVTFVASWFLAGLAQPDEYNSFDHRIVDLGALTAEQPWIFNQIGANLTGLLLVGFALGLWRVLGSRPSALIGCGALLVAGTGIFLVGLFRPDCREFEFPCVEHVPWQWTANEDAWRASVIAMTVTPFVLARALRKTEWDELWIPSLAVVPVAFAALLVFGAVGEQLGVRVAVSLWFLWIALLAWRMLRMRHPPPLKVAEPVPEPEREPVPEPEEVVVLPPVVVSRWARAFIHEHGGSVYVWTKPFAGGDATLSASPTRPREITFELHSEDGVRIFLEEGLLAPPLRIGVRRFPHSKLIAFGPW